jgi:two-component system NtrC family response regulator
MEEFRILVVDDEPSQREILRGFLAREGWTVDTAGSGTDALTTLRKQPFDLCLVDYRMSGMNGLELLKQVKTQTPEATVVIITAYGSINSAVEAMKLGAYDYLTKPIDLDELSHLIGKIQERQHLLTEIRELRERLIERFRFDQIVGESGKMQEVLSLVARIAPSDATVLIRGESGTGKELIAKAIHYNSPRRAQSFVKVNIAALPENLLESELFGHEKGAFTGAVEQRIGRFEAADGGTLFLDEIGDLPLALQVKLLRVLQEREVERVGSNNARPVDIRIIAATNQDLEKELEEKRFREDLYYRLNVVPIFLPPLRERREDIPPLIDFLLQKFAKQSGKEVKGVSREAMSLLIGYHYPGNIRELENILERAVLLTRYNLITLEDLPVHLREFGPEKLGPLTSRQMTLPQTLEALEKQMILRALEQHDSVQTRAAEELGISERMLRYKMKKYGV